MPEFSMSNTASKTQFSGRLISDFHLFCSFVLSHPLYFSYLIFFSPYLLKLVSFLSPLFITTSLLLLAFLTFSCTELPESKLGSLCSAYANILNKLQHKDNEEELFRFEELEVYKIVFESSTYDAEENPVEQSEEKCIEAIEETVEMCSKDSGNVVTLAPSVDLDGNPDAVSEPFMEAMTLESFLQEKVEEKEVNPPVEDFNKVKEHEEKLSIGRGSKATDGDKISEVSVTKEGIENDGYRTPKGVEKSQSIGEYFSSNDDVGDFNYAAKVTENLESLRANFGFSDQDEEPNAKVDENKKILGENLGIKVLENPQTIGDYIRSNENVGDCNYTPKSRVTSRKFGANFSFADQETESNAEIETPSPKLGSFGSMRKEKEWRRTLACKLFEERHNVNVDGTEGMDSLWETYETESVKTKGTKTNNDKKGKNAGAKHYEDDEEDEDEDEQLCCLQALKFSTGKMNLGMGRPNLVKFSKALKGFGWLHHVSKHGRKIYR